MPSLTAEEKSALAISGWLLGGDQADKDLSLAIALVKVRDVVRQYLTEPLATERQALVNSNLSLGGVTVQGGSSVEAARRIMEDALAMEAAGCWAVLMEAVPAELAGLITRRLKVPTIGIGAGPGCDGQVLLTHEMLGLFAGLGLPWGKRYLDAGALMGQAIRQYADDIHAGAFPGAENSFPIDPAILRELEA